MLLCPKCHRHYSSGAPALCPEDGATLTDAPEVTLLASRPTKDASALLDGRYAIKGLLGYGGMARVYLADDVKTHRAVAIKVMNREVARTPTARERFLQEIEVAATIQHPNVVEVLDAGDHPDGTPYIVLEFLHGESFGDLLRRDERVELAFALPMLAQAAAGLAAAHAAGVVHRDIKPDNLMLLGTRGAPTTVKIVDFGMAKLREGQKLTATGIALGTLAYVSPEQALGDPVDERTDIYSFGVLMFRVLTGKLPFDDPDDARLVASHVYTPPPSPSSIHSGLDPRLESMILTALRKRRENRYPNMRLLADDLERVAGTRFGAVVPRPIAFTPDTFEPTRPTAIYAASALRRALKG